MSSERVNVWVISVAGWSQKMVLRTLDEVLDNLKVELSELSGAVMELATLASG